MQEGYNVKIKNSVYLCFAWKTEQLKETVNKIFNDKKHCAELWSVKHNEEIIVNRIINKQEFNTADYICIRCLLII